MIQAAEIEQMSVEHRLQAMELLWNSLVGTPEAVPSPEWHGEVLAERLAKVERGEGQFLSLAEVQAQLQSTSLRGGWREGDDAVMGWGSPAPGRPHH